MEPYLLTTDEEYLYCTNRGFNPLLDTVHFRMTIHLRVKIQRELFGHCIFGRGEDIMKANGRFFRWIWDHRPHICEETMRPLYGYSATYCSHILSRGAHPEMAHDPRNINILNFESHNRWEHGDRENMRIYPGNLAIIELLKKEYRELRT